MEPRASQNKPATRMTTDTALGVRAFFSGVWGVVRDQPFPLFNSTFFRLEATRPPSPSEGTTLVCCVFYSYLFWTSSLCT